jgi:hypothetical protein
MFLAEDIPRHLPKGTVLMWPLIRRDPTEETATGEEAATARDLGLPDPADIVRAIETRTLALATTSADDHHHDLLIAKHPRSALMTRTPRSKSRIALLRTEATKMNLDEKSKSMAFVRDVVEQITLDGTAN